MLKWRKKRGVTGLRPPPGGAQAAAMIISFREEKQIEEGEYMHKKKYPRDII